MEDGNRLGKTAVRCMALHLRMMRLLGRMSLKDIELLLEQGRIHDYGRGATIPISANGERCHLLVLEGEITVLQDPSSSGNESFKATDAVYGYVPLLIDTHQQVTVTAVTGTRCLLLDAGLAERLSGSSGQVQDSTAFMGGCKIA